MTLIRTLAVHEIVRAVHPRPFTEADELGRAEGKAIDSALSRYNYETTQGRRPTAAAMSRLAVSLLDEELKDGEIELDPDARRQVLHRISEVLKAFRQSEIFGLLRPKTRLVLINRTVGIYAQPDYWDGQRRFFEMKSYRAVPPPPDVALQLTLFQLAFPGFEGSLICFNRLTTPVEVTCDRLPPLSDDQVHGGLRQAYRIGMDVGKEKVLEYVDSPIIQYEVSIETT